MKKDSVIACITSSGFYPDLGTLVKGMVDRGVLTHKYPPVVENELEGTPLRPMCVAKLPIWNNSPDKHTCHEKMKSSL